MLLCIHQIHLKCFLWYVVDVGVAPEMMVDDYNHTIGKGSMYLKCKSGIKSEKKGKVFMYCLHK